MIFFAGACVSIATAAILAEEPAAGSTSAKAKSASGPPPIMSAEASTIAATVGDAKITCGKINKILQGLPPGTPQNEKISKWNWALNELIFAELSHVYLKKNHINYTKKNMANVRKRIAEMATKEKMTPEQLMEKAGFTEENLQDLARTENLIEQTTNQQTLDDFIKTHPDCFNGTKIQARHILIPCKPLASTKKQKAAKAKLEKIAADIRTGKLKFEDAAGMNSACPSKERGGMLPEFLFTHMVPPFSVAAFETDVGRMSGIVRTDIGFHLIKIIKRTEGKEKPNPKKAKEIARRVLLAELQNKLFDQALTTVPIVINEPQTKPAERKTVEKK